ncbi:MAG TPA: ABC transporter ATP-binding protein [Candidatus Limnocylindria bacterium]|jgi:branched-chain amino acid transport system ATP-binding protein|nr:ABC transporter ATP-binding protein [Candidatus Limnocylindria bacterium]
MLRVTELDAGYGFLRVVHGISLQVNQGELVALLGPNGAGKSTTLKCIAGLVRPWKGDITFQGRSIGGMRGDRVNGLGIGLVSESLNLFTGMTVYENLLMGAYSVPEAEKRRRSLDFVFGLFPRLAERRPQLAGTLSGGERKMLAIGRALMGGPSLLLVDEPSLGLAPKLTQQVFDALRKLSDDGLTILLVEQNVTATLEMVDRAYVLEQGEIVLEGSAQKLSESEHVKDVYLGVMA